VPVTLTVGPPGSGKTHAAIRAARAAAADGRRIWWIGLPAQRAHVLRALAHDGPLLGVEFLSPQQLAYRVLSDARRLRPLLTGTGRLATVGRALLEDRGDPPNPGEARLFARAIAEAKRHGVAPGRVPGSDDETARLRRVFAAYERRKADRWDYDDFRREAAAWLEAAGPDDATPDLLPDLAIVDGLRELAPADLRLTEALGRHAQVRVAVMVAPPGREPDEVLPPREDVPPHRHAFANPVAEARWVLRDVKAALADGADPLDLALIVPPGRARAIATLAAEYGVPLMDETPRGLADRPEGRRLLDLLELAEHPTASRLLAVPELHALGVAALEAGASGADAIDALAEARGAAEAWRAWQERLAPGEDPLAWGADLVDVALDAVRAARASHRPEEAEEAERFRELALQRLAEARQVASGPGLRLWWSALLQQTVVLQRPDAGVALLHAVQASGRRFRRVWIVGAREGAHLQREREDYFVPEEARSAWPATFDRPLLPKRFLARQEDEAAELLARGDVTRVGYAEADQGGRAVPDPLLLDGPTQPPPDRPAGSVLDLGAEDLYRPPDGPVALGPPDVGRLVRFARCGLRTWAEERLGGQEDDPPWWVRLRSTLRARERWSEDDLRALGGEVPEADDWLDRVAPELAGLSFGVSLRGGEDGPVARLDAARRDAGHALLVRFAAPGSVPDARAADDALDRRGVEYWAADLLSTRHARQVRSVRFRVWPILGEPVDVPDGRSISTRSPWARFARVRREVDAAHALWTAGEARANPGWACRDCPVYDLCREGRR
jgi:hypothetical protein